MELLLNFFLSCLCIILSVFVYEIVSSIVKKARRKIIYRKFVGTAKKVNEFLEESESED